MTLLSQFVMTTGVSPGIGKSTLAMGLVARAAHAHRELELFDVAQIFSRSTFSDIGRAFRDRTYPTAESMLRGYASVVDELAPTGGVVFDWDCLGMVSDLPWAEGRPDVLLRHAVDVFEIAHPLRPVLLNLVGDIDVAVARAAAQRGESWVRRYSRLAVMDGARSRMRLAAINEWMKRQLHQALELQAFGKAGWPVWEVDAMQPAEDVLNGVAIRLGIPRA